MQTLNDVHQQFAEYFDVPSLKPYLYALSKKMSEGHINIDITRIGTEDMPEVYKDILAKKEPMGTHLIAKGALEYEPFVLYDGRLYLHRYFQYETQLLQRIVALIQVGRMDTEARMQLLVRHKGFIQDLFGNDMATDTDWQLVAALTAVLNNFTIITGGPGTGKTTTVAKILAILFNIQPELKVALAAPTGKAGARMAESLINAQLNVNDHIRSRFNSLKPATIHRLLGWQKGTPYFRHHANHPLPFDLVIVDESSMIDVALFSKLLNAIGPQTRIILLGDKDQLASVEAGSLFGDLCKAQVSLNLFNAERRGFVNSFIDNGLREIPKGCEAEHEVHHPLFQHLVELRYSHRFKGTEGIGQLSRAVINNDVPILKEFLNKNDSGQVYIDVDYNTVIFEQFISGYGTYIEEDNIKLALEKFNQLRVLCAVRQGEQGIHNINAVIETYLIKHKKIIKDNLFYKNRPVMVTQNNYALGLYNGDVGILREDENGIMKAWFADNTEGNIGQLKSVLPGFITQMDTVFAMTIHKSQGSEFNRVMIILPKNAGHQLLTRELLYTGITRAKEKAIIQSGPETLLVTAQGMVERGSGIVERLSKTMMT